MAKKKHEVKPGAHVGRPSSADDDVPQIEMRRGLTIQHADRGRVARAQRNRTSDPDAKPRRGSRPDRNVRK